MGARKPGRLVYSTESGSVCPRCGWPEKSCRCSSRLDSPVPEKIVARLALEKAGRRGKTVSVIYGLPRNRGFLEPLARELKKRCGSGGTTFDDRIEIQGDHLDALRELLRARGWTVKG